MNNKFTNAETMIFWAYSSMMIKKDKGYQRSCSAYSGRHVCEALDVFTLLNRVRTEMGERYFDALVKYFPRYRAPNKLIWGERNDADLWDNMCRRVEIYSKAKGWIE